MRADTSLGSFAEWVGRRADRRVRISPELVDRFISLSGDSSPIHVADSAAVTRGFPRRVVHGMLLGSLLSAVLGTELPGACGVLEEIRLSFRHPCFVDDDIVISVVVTEAFESVRVLRLKATIANQHGRVLASGSVQAGVSP